MSCSSDFNRWLRGARRALFGPPVSPTTDLCSVRHHWKYHSLERVMNDNRQTIAHDHVLQCRRCGELKKVRT